MSFMDTLKSLADINTWNKSPWDKISHTLLGLAFAAPIFAITKDAGIATAAGAFMLYGREEAQAEKKVGYVKAWFPWYWTKDGILDVAIPAPIMYGILYGVSLTGII